MANLCRLGRDSYFRASSRGFAPHIGSEARVREDATTNPAWPGGPWPADGPASSLHMVGLVLGNAAAGRIGEFGALLDAGDVFWGLPGQARGAIEVTARLFGIYLQPLLPHAGTEVPLAAVKTMYAAAHLELLDAAFSRLKLATAYAELDPADSSRVAEVASAETQLARLQGAYAPWYDQATTDVSTARRLRFEGVRAATMTSTIDAMAAWIWPDPEKRPRPIYRVFSGYAHTSLDADLSLYARTTADGREAFIRRIPDGFVDNSIATALIFFQRILARLVGYYGWDETPLHEFSEELADVFPRTFSYGDATS
jgi:hypothetical protein